MNAFEHNLQSNKIAPKETENDEKKHDRKKNFKETFHL